MAVVDSPAHLLSLKVMRVSRPEVPGAWQPFFSSSPHLSAHASASILSLQGNTPLHGHPKTLRDLTHASDLLALPSSFGAIQLGQTFSSCLSVNNEAPFSVDSILIRVEMQTVTAKTLLYHTSHPAGQTLPTGDTLECIVGHEIKELGQHVLACTVTYRLPPNVKPIPGASEDPTDPSLQTFRKFYKFLVTNPLAVKTKVHPVRSPTALLTPSEREKIFLEVHIQNVTQETMHFERLSFEPTDEWLVEDPNITSDDQSVVPGSTSGMNPQDIRQYIFILSPTTTSALRPLAVTPPGSIFPLGRLNIVWRSTFGEPGRLLTNTLTRRIPLVNPGPPSTLPTTQQPASALPLHLKREKMVPSRPQSPNPQSRPSTPPQNTRSPGTIPPPNLKFTTTSSMEAHLTLRDPIPPSIKVGVSFKLGLTLHVTLTTSATQDARPPLLFAIQHVLPPPPLSTTTVPALSTIARVPPINTGVGQAQGSGSGYNTPRSKLSPTSSHHHHNPHFSQPQSTPMTVTQATLQTLSSPRASLSVLSSGFSTPTAASSHGGGGGGDRSTTVGTATETFNYTLARQKLLVASPREMNSDHYAGHSDAVVGGIDEDGYGEGEGDGDVIYPPPYPLGLTTSSSGSDTGMGTVVPTGASSFVLPPLTLSPRDIPLHPSSSTTSNTTSTTTTSTSMHTSFSSTSTIDSTDSESQTHPSEEIKPENLYASYDFEITYVPLRMGFSCVGGVRILYLGEGELEARGNGRNGSDDEDDSRGDAGLEIRIEGKSGVGEKRKAQIINEYGVVAEILVSS